MTPRWLRSAAATKYCGYKSVSRFLELMTEHRVPRHGPHGRHFDRLELDRWMLDPDVFQRHGSCSAHRRGGYRKIAL